MSETGIRWKSQPSGAPSQLVYGVAELDLPERFSFPVLEDGVPIVFVQFHMMYWKMNNDLACKGYLMPRTEIDYWMSLSSTEARRSTLREIHLIQKMIPHLLPYHTIALWPDDILSIQYPGIQSSTPLPIPLILPETRHKVSATPRETNSGGKLFTLEEERAIFWQARRVVPIGTVHWNKETCDTEDSAHECYRISRGHTTLHHGAQWDVLQKTTLLQFCGPRQGGHRGPIGCTRRDSDGCHTFTDIALTPYFLMERYSMPTSNHAIMHKSRNDSARIRNKIVNVVHEFIECAPSASEMLVLIGKYANREDIKRIDISLLNEFSYFYINGGAKREDMQKKRDFHKACRELKGKIRPYQSLRDLGLRGPEWFWGKYPADRENDSDLDSDGSSNGGDDGDDGNHDDDDGGSGSDPGGGPQSGGGGSGNRRRPTQSTTNYRSPRGGTSSGGDDDDDENDGDDDDDDEEDDDNDDEQPRRHRKLSRELPSSQTYHNLTRRDGTGHESEPGSDRGEDEKPKLEPLDIIDLTGFDPTGTIDLTWDDTDSEDELPTLNRLRRRRQSFIDSDSDSDIVCIGRAPLFSSVPDGDGSSEPNLTQDESRQQIADAIHRAERRRQRSEPEVDMSDKVEHQDSKDEVTRLLRSRSEPPAGQRPSKRPKHHDNCPKTV